MMDIEPKFEREGGVVRSFKLVLLLMLLISLLAGVIQNLTPWQVRFFWITGEVPGIILLLLASTAGFLAGITAALLMQHKQKHNIK